MSALKDHPWVAVPMPDPTSTTTLTQLPRTPSRGAQRSNNPGCRVAVLNAAVESSGLVDEMPAWARAV